MAKSNAEKRAAFIESLRTDSVSQEQADEKREQVTGNNASDNGDNNEVMVKIKEKHRNLSVH